MLHKIQNPKPSLELEYAEAAREDLDEIEAFLESEASATVAEKVVDGIVSRCEDLPDMPKASKDRNEIAPGLRSVTAGSYVIYFKILEDKVYVVRVLHGSRDTSALKREL